MNSFFVFLVVLIFQGDGSWVSFLPLQLFIEMSNLKWSLWLCESSPASNFQSLYVLRGILRYKGFDFLMHSQLVALKYSHQM